MKHFFLFSFNERKDEEMCSVYRLIQFNVLVEYLGYTFVLGESSLFLICLICAFALRLPFHIHTLIQHPNR